VKPEQSNPAVVVPAHLYFVPIKSEIVLLNTVSAEALPTWTISSATKLNKNTTAFFN
jgi:hypothetical protein